MSDSDVKECYVQDIMRTEFDLIEGSATVAEALREMRHHETKALIVDKRHERDEYGILLISDIARNVLARDRSPERINVYEVMAKPVLSVDPGMNIRYCARLFDRFDISRAPVIENNKAVGLVSLSDLVLRGFVRIGW